MELLTKEKCSIKLTEMIVKRESFIYKITNAGCFIEYLKKSIENLILIKNNYINIYKENFDLQNKDIKIIVLSFMKRVTDEINNNSKLISANEKAILNYTEEINNINFQITTLQELIAF
jgi:hypothetical protein